MADGVSPLDALDVVDRDGVVGIYFVPASETRENAVVVLEMVGGPKAFAYYWVGSSSWMDDLLPDWKWSLPDDAIELWREPDRPHQTSGTAAG